MDDGWGHVMDLNDPESDPEEPICDLVGAWWGSEEYQLGLSYSDPSYSVWISDYGYDGGTHHSDGPTAPCEDVDRLWRWESTNPRTNKRHKNLYHGKTIRCYGSLEQARKKRKIVYTYIGFLN